MLNDWETCLYDCVLHPLVHFLRWSSLSYQIFIFSFAVQYPNLPEQNRHRQPAYFGASARTESLCALPVCALYQLNRTNPFIMLPADESIAIVELFVYPLVLIAVLFVLVRHCLKAQAGFIFLASFTIVRIIGASFEIAATKNRTGSNPTWAAVLQSLGLGPLLMSTSSLLKRV